MYANVYIIYTHTVYIIYITDDVVQLKESMFMASFPEEQNNTK